uniref:probable inactive ATP-dependent zinc metalloprotease FTSHI 3, chloroplastic n=1 Tax=Erigeron canadensis TaxID=72917 RepID=UPI001CB88B57|nr:probable inactive ATP-dependent zinc metalloprotease FTSHI 3, chloroplastic [Erigeron canadensis]XP_043609318.1 probable inactive ATP-dependent zinc metalloprotease FTSHI 3, chloroplastic [Erigeron canadensis]
MDNQVLSFSVSRPLHLHSARLLLTNNQIARSFTFQRHCTNVENLVESITGYDSRSWKQCAPKKGMLYFGPIKCVWAVLFALFVTLKTILQSKKKEPRNVSFDELVGVDATIKKIRHIIPILQGKSEAKKFGAELPDGLMLYGPQGTGKTTLVHALAREAGVSFFPISAHDMAKDDTGSIGIDTLFIEARAYSPSIVLIEDVDVIARKGRCESDPSLRQLDLEIESCNKDGSMVMVIVTPIKPETLDSASMRSCRFFKKVHMGLPDEDSRRKITGVHLNMVAREEDKEAICNLVASRTHGLVWDDIKSIAVDSKIFALSRGDDHVTMDDVLNALGMLNDSDD